MRYKIFLSCSMSILFSLLFNNFSFSQSSDYRLQLFFFANDSSYLRSLTFGGHTDATYCIDKNLGEMEQPPSPPSPSFDVRFIDPRGFNVNCMGLGLDVDIRKWSSIATKDTFKIKFQFIGTEFPLTVNWNNTFSNYLISATLSNRLNNSTIKFDMLDNTEYVLDDPDITTYYLIIEKKPLWANTPPPTPVQLLPHDRLPVLEDSVLFVWKPVGGADNYRFQIAKDFLFNNLVFSDSVLTDTTFIFRQLELNVEYFWRVQATNSNGYSCYTVRSFKYIIPPIRAPGLFFPSYSAIGISRTPVLMWTRVQVATSYELQVATDGSFNNLVFHDSTITETYQQIGPLEIDRIYYWRVRSKNSSETSPFSSASHFKVSLPTVPRLWSPQNKELGVSNRPNFVWDVIIGSTNYRLQIARDSLFLDKVFDDSTLTQSSPTVGPLLIDTKYYWRVQGGNDCGWGNYSLVREFTVSFPSVPILKSPLNETIDVALRSNFFMYSQFGAKFYNLQVSRDSLFNQIVHEDTMGIFRYNLGPFIANTLYYWRARAINDNGVSEFSLISQFTTGTDSIPLRFSIPLIFNTSSTTNKDTLKFGGHKFGTDCIDENIGEHELQPLAPGYDVRFIDSRTGYEWCLGNGVKSDFREWYWYYVNRVDSFQISIQAEPADYPIEISWPAYLSSYYSFIEIWEVGGTQIVDMRSSRNIIISNNLVSKLKIYTMNIVEGTWTFNSRLGSPIDGAEITTLTPTLTWSSSEDVSSYRLQLATNPMFNNPIIDDYWVTQTFRTVGPLIKSTRYYWRVEVRMTSGVSWSPISRFTTSSIVSVKDKDITSKVYQLYQNYPNPFNPYTSIEFQLKEESYVAIQVFNTLGQQVAVLTNREIYEEGRHEIIFEAGNLPSGVYFYRMVIENLSDNREQQTFMKKMLLLK